MNNRIIIEGVVFDFESYFLRKGDFSVYLSEMEMKLLKLLIDNRGRVVTKQEISEVIWGVTEGNDENVVQLTHKIRRVMKNLSIEHLIKTKRNMGYIFSGEDDDINNDMRYQSDDSIHHQDNVHIGSKILGVVNKSNLLIAVVTVIVVFILSLLILNIINTLGIQTLIDRLNIK
ncbi:winged helix-turn-helix domain-containing protein [Budvicia diplopodorum]|uniref:winged helix-turn-helix domain-containing protein n=1 Tax=Budvicia diplopodorum TaxID=1119056 RepID=UPI00135BCB3E|nr:winged helix-turn-helix domain-containing protein [Budvicia diplopodorum]